MTFGRFREEDVTMSIDPSIAAIVKDNTAFAIDLYKRLQKTKGNLFFSPYSISVALAMTYAGALGETKQQMAQALHFSAGQQLHPVFSSLESELKTAQSDGILLRSANSLYPQTKYPFLEAFLGLVKEHYGADITSVDYENNLEEARVSINNWVTERTEEKIRDLIPSGMINALTRLVLVNAIYFKGNWASQFDPKYTKVSPFWVTPDREIQVSMMQKEETFGYYEDENVKVLELPYIGDRLSMLILLPQQMDGLTELESSLTQESLALWTRYLHRAKVQVYLPRFKINCPINLNGNLKAMGMRDAFDDSKANFSGMDGRENWLFIGEVIHQAFIDVNEEGSEAAAATAVVMKSRSLPTPSIVFQANHPFVFLIQDKYTGTVLFLGRFATPELV
jgi:serpin B